LTTQARGGASPSNPIGSRGGYSQDRVAAYVAETTAVIAKLRAQLEAARLEADFALRKRRVPLVKRVWATTRAVCDEMAADAATRSAAILDEAQVAADSYIAGACGNAAEILARVRLLLENSFGREGQPPRPSVLQDCDQLLSSLASCFPRAGAPEPPAGHNPGGTSTNGNGRGHAGPRPGTAGGSLNGTAFSDSGLTTTWRRQMRHRLFPAGGDAFGSQVVT